MYKNMYEPEPLRIELSAQKILVSLICLFAFFVIPAQVISIYKDRPTNTEVVQASDEDTADEKSEGKVAGVSTDTEQSKSFSIDFSNDSTRFLLAGIFFMSISMSLFGYLIYDHLNYKKAVFNS